MDSLSLSLGGLLATVIIADTFPVLEVGSLKGKPSENRQ